MTTAPTRVLLLPRADLVDLCQRRPAVALAMLETLARRLRHFAAIVSDVTFRPVQERVARHLETVAGALVPGVEVPLGLTHAQLAARLGTVRELVARALAELEKSGVIQRKRGRVVIRDPARLGAVARGEPSPPDTPV